MSHYHVRETRLRIASWLEISRIKDGTFTANAFETVLILLSDACMGEISDRHCTQWQIWPIPHECHLYHQTEEIPYRLGEGQVWGGPALKPRYLPLCSQQLLLSVVYHFLNTLKCCCVPTRLQLLLRAQAESVHPTPPPGCIFAAGSHAVLPGTTPRRLLGVAQRHLTG